MLESQVVKIQLQQLDIKVKELLKKLQIASEHDTFTLVDELNEIALNAGQLAYGENELDWLTDRLEMLIWKTDHLDEIGALDQLIDEVCSGAFK